MKFKKDDTVKITTGKDKSRTGKILAVFPKKDKILVEGVNMYKRHRKPVMGQAGGIIDRPRPLSLAKIALVCPKCHKPTRVGYQLDSNGKEKTRLCRKCGKLID